MHASEPLHEECQLFLVQIAEAGAAVYYNRLLEIELADVAFKIAVDERHGKGAWRRQSQLQAKDGRVCRRAARLTARLMESWQELLTTVDHLCIELGEVSDRVPELMRFGLRSNDAVHAATCEFAGSALVTTDAGFGVVPASRLTLYVNQTRLAPTRRLRGRKTA